MSDWNRLEIDYIEAVQECEKDRYLELNSKYDRLDELNLIIKGIPDTPYKGGTFKFELALHGYPWEVPRVFLHTKIWHPNIYPNADYQRYFMSNICHSLIDQQNLGKPGGWMGPGSSLLILITSLKGLLSIPHGWTIPRNDPGLNGEAARQYKNNRSLFMKTAREWTRRYAK